MTVVLPDIDSISRLDFTPVLPCESAACEGLATPATYRYRASGPCGHAVTKLYCTPHAEKVAAVMHEPALIYCEDCRWNTIGRLCEWASLEPLS